MGIKIMSRSEKEEGQHNNGFASPQSQYFLLIKLDLHFLSIFNLINGKLLLYCIPAYTFFCFFSSLDSPLLFPAHTVFSHLDAASDKKGLWPFLPSIFSGLRLQTCRLQSALATQFSTEVRGEGQAGDCCVQMELGEVDFMADFKMWLCWITLLTVGVAVVPSS